MNRERAETFLRLLAEAELREWGPRTRGAGGTAFVTMPVALPRAAWALTAVDAVDLETAEAILADTDLALDARRPPEPEEAVSGQAAPGPRRFAGIRFTPRPGPRPAVAAAAPQHGPDRHGPARYVPVGRMILFHDETISGELDLMSYVHTASGARLIAAWQTRDPLGSRPRGLPPVGDFTVTDDRGSRYHLRFAAKGRRESACDLSLRPDPPPDVRWLDVTAPGERAVRVDLGGPDGLPAPQVSDQELSAGEHLLNRIADRLLTMIPEFPPQTTPGPLTNLAAGLGATIAALEAAEVLPACSPVPGQLAALCASLGVRGHGITAAPAPDLPEPWLSVLSHYRRRKPETAPARDGFAAVAAALPEFDGISLVLLGLHNCAGATWLNALARGRLPRHQPGPLRVEVAFPLSIWIRDDAGRWHVARPAGWHDDGGEAALTLRLIPPLTRSPDLIEVRAAGLSAQARAAVPVRWGYRP
jgi:hypothetical protein